MYCAWSEVFSKQEDTDCLFIWCVSCEFDENTDCTIAMIMGTIRYRGMKPILSAWQVSLADLSIVNDLRLFIDYC